MSDLTSNLKDHNQGSRYLLDISQGQPERKKYDQPFGIKSDFEMRICQRIVRFVILGRFFAHPTILLVGCPSFLIPIQLTLAETPNGPQVWNWTAQSFLPGAELAWQPADGGYIYEAALPLESLNFLEPEGGKKIYFEAGKGFTTGFIDWTGLDPDTAENLAPLTFVTELSQAAKLGELPGQSPEDVAFAVSLDGGKPFVVNQAISPDRDYLWLDPLFDGPKQLNRGPHNLLVTYAGRKSDREAIVDAFMIVPSIACKSFEDNQEVLLTLYHDMGTAVTTWEESE